MRIAIVCDKPARLKSTVPIIVSGIKACGDECKVYNQPLTDDSFDAVIIVGTPVISNTIRNLTYNAQPISKTFFFDSAPFTGDVIYRTLSYAGIKGRAKYNIPDNVDNSRWEKIKSDLSLIQESWQDKVKDNNIWILAHNEKSLTTTLNRPQYEVKQLAEHLLNIGYKTYVKSHPNLPIYQNVSLDYIVKQRPRLCMAWHTHAVGYMLLKGVPCVILDEYSLFFKYCPNKLSDNMYFDRQQMFNEIAWSQWSLDEFKNGYAWNHCRELLNENIICN